MPVVVTDGANTDIDFTLRPTPIYVVSGRVMNAIGGAADGAQVLLEQVGLPAGVASRRLPVRTDHDGRFSIPDVSAGEYLLATRGPGATSSRDIIRITSSRVDVSVHQTPGSDVQGTTREESASPRRDLRIVLEPVDRSQERLEALVNASGVFALKSVAPGDYTVRATRTGPFGSVSPSIRSVKSSSVSAGALQIRAGHDVTDLLVVMANWKTLVSGAVLDGANQPKFDCLVMIMRKDESEAASVRPATDGSYSFENLRPGEYLIGILDSSPREASRTELFREFRPRGAVLVLAEGQHLVQDLRAQGPTADRPTMIQQR